MTNVIQVMVKWGKRLALGVLLLLAGVLAGRVYEIWNGPELQPWHTFVPHEMQEKALDKASWDDYLNAEARVFAEVRRNVTDKLDDRDRNGLNRYDIKSRVYPETFPDDWNRSYVLRPQGPPRGAVVLLHGLTDSPYSLRHVARFYQQAGYVAVGIRLPAHGTVPGALTDVAWEDWLAATRLAVREATRLGGPDAPLHIVGFSNGGALAMKYTLDALEDPRLVMPQQIVLISPMIGVTSFARFAGIAGWPAVFPAFARAAWLGIVPEFNPFKYNSFPVNAARQSYLLTRALQKQIVAQARQPAWQRLPPVLTFQSVMDSTVSTRAVVNALYNYLPDNHSELVLFDLNRAVSFRTLFRRSSDTALARLLPPVPRRYDTTIVTNAAPDSLNVLARSTAAGGLTESDEALDTPYPSDIYSLSHVALPFPVTDSLYGREPAEPDRYGVSFGTLAVRGESSVLMVGLDSLMRISSNPFFPYMLKRIDEEIQRSGGAKRATGG